MSDRELAGIVCRALLAIVAALTRKYNLPIYKNVTIEVKSNEKAPKNETVTSIPEYKSV